jgi:hypothetical protein
MRKILLASLLLASSAIVLATSTIKPVLDPPARLAVKRQDHIYDLIVTLPPQNRNYTPGITKVYLRKEYPDYLMVEIPTDILPSKKVHAHFAINPSFESKYWIMVHNNRGGDTEFDVLFYGQLADIPRI